MKKLSIIFLMVLFPVIGNGQMVHKSKYNKLDKDQLNLALSKSMKRIKTGKILTAVGAGLGITGGIMLIDDKSKQNTYDSRTIHLQLPSNELVTGAFFLVGAAITEMIAIPTWAIGSKHKKNIEIELLKFNPRGSASIDGIGLKIRF